MPVAPSPPGRIPAAVRPRIDLPMTGGGTRWLRSVPTEAAVSDLVADRYGLEVRSVNLVRSWINDVHRVETTDGTFALKLYAAGRWSAEEILWEQRLALHLEAAGVLPAGPVPLVDGRPVGSIEAPEGERCFALTTWVPGEKPRPPWTPALYRDVGESLARLHEAADAFTTDLPRRPLLDGSEAQRVIEALADDLRRCELVQRISEVAQERLTELAARGLRHGICHGDATLDNLHVAGGGIAFYDLDNAGPAWQASDLVGALATEFSEPFLEGYTSRRPLGEADLEALPVLRIGMIFENLVFHLVTKPSLQGSVTLGEGWVDHAFTELERTAREVGIDGV